MLALAAPAAYAQAAQKGEPGEAEVIKALHAKEAEIGPEKQSFVRSQLQLTQEELAKFDPIYAEHQAALKRFNQRRLDNVVAFSREYNNDSLTEADAHKLALEALAIEREEHLELELLYGKVRTVLPAKKAALYLQLESKLRTLVRFKQASATPLVKAK